jgi:hypothetical protein
MSDENKMDVTIDDAIRARPDLLAHVAAAQESFEQQYFSPPLDREQHSPAVAWKLRPLRGSEEVGLEFHERDKLGERRFTKSWPVQFISDPTAREYYVARLLGTVFQLRSEQRMKYVDYLLAQVDSQGDDLGNER